MAWRSGIGESGLELSLGLPAYFSKNSSASVQAEADGEGSNRAAAFAVQSNGSSSSKARTAAAPVVGWPPVRSFRRNLASSSSSKPATSSSQNAEKSSKDGGGGCSGGNEHAQKGMFVKINMDGVPIGRKVDLTAYGGYAELSSAVDKLFRGLLAAQRDPAGPDGEADVATGEMVGGGEYTLVYEDDEGDRMLVGDVPWQMFIATAKRLRVLKSADLPPPSLMRAAGSRKRAAADS
ncbi:auxin-responsive protein IAA2-like [Oryza brachyantha]|uniref:auxin-responsive protein IAA2-like n=1 Tax=Oryza brachyantha TaxID=4533 RepID=UPI000776439B|nr:auxin-responsive protein IAA2-like [Oryza brachyantha]